ncbi:MAG: hypothetical protein V7750_15240 [Sneathiella sp.]
MAASETLPKNLTDLRFAEQITLWGIRYWADSFKQKHRFFNVLHDAYRLAKCPESLFSLDSFMTILIGGNCRPVDIRCLCCSGISVDEWRILQSIAVIQAGHKEEAARFISHFLEPSATRHALPILRDWANNLEQNNHMLPVRAVARSRAARYFPDDLEQSSIKEITSLNQQPHH